MCGAQKLSSGIGRWGTCGKRRKRASEKEGRCSCWCGLSWSPQPSGHWLVDPAVCAVYQSDVLLGTPRKTGSLHHKPIHARHANQLSVPNCDHHKLNTAELSLLGHMSHQINQEHEMKGFSIYFWDWLQKHIQSSKIQTLVHRISHLRDGNFFALFFYLQKLPISWGSLASLKSLPKWINYRTWIGWGLVCL